MEIFYHIASCQLRYLFWYTDTMYQIIHERIEVAGVYKNARFEVRKFLWKDREFKVSEVTLVSDVRDGAARLRWYSVVAKGTVYRIIFNRETEVWWLEEVWVE